MCAVSIPVQNAAASRAGPRACLRAGWLGLLALVGAAFLCPHPALAVDKVWTGATDTTWGTNTNWTGNAPSAGDNAVFNGPLTNQPNVTANTSAGGIWRTTGVGQNVTISGAGILQLSGGTINGIAGLGILVDNTGATTMTINAPLKLGGAQTWRNSSGNLFTIGGAVDLNAKALIVDGTGDTTLSGVVSNTGTFTKDGTGTLTLSGTASNTFTGAFTVNGGTVLLNKSTNLDALAGALVIGDGVGLDTVRTLAGNQLNGAALTINSSGLLDLNGFSQDITTLSMTGGSITTGAGTLTLMGNVSGNANATAATISGKVALSANRTFTIADGAAAVDMDISAAVSGAFTVTKGGAGTMVFSGANTYTGVTTVSAGVLNIQNASALGTTATGTTVSNGAALQIQGGIAVGAEALTISGSGIASDGALRNISGTNSMSGTVTLSAAASIGSDAGVLTLSGVITDGGAKFLLAKVGAGELILSGNNSFEGFDLNAGRVGIGSATALGGNKKITLNGGDLYNASGAPLTISAQGLDIFADFTISGSQDLTFSALSALKATSTINVTNTGLTTLSGILSGAGFGMTKTGAGTLALSGANTYTGTNTINGGTVVINSTSSLGALANATTINAATLEASATITTTRAFTLGNAASAIMVDPAQTFTVNTGIVGTGGLTKTGTGTLALGAANTFNGNTTVSAGTLAANADSALGSTAKVTINTGGTVLLGTTAGNNRISNTAEVALAGGTLNTGGFSETVGKMTLSGNSTLDLGAGASLLTFDGTSTLGTSGLTVLNWSGTQGSTGGTDQLLFTNSSFVGGTSTTQIQFNVGGTFYAADFRTINGNTIEAIANLTVVPEPATIFGAGALLLALAWRERRRLARLRHIRDPRSGKSPALCRHREGVPKIHFPRRGAEESESGAEEYFSSSPACRSISSAPLR